MKKVIVTGANGFIGTALCKKLSDEGINVIAIVRDKEENITKIKDIPRLKITYCDLSDFRNLSKYVEDRDIDALYHLAWVGSAGALRGDSDVQIRNIQYTCDTVKACLDMNCKRFIFASSIMEYEIQATMVTDTMPSINTLYSSAKVAADYMARTLSGSYGIDYIRAVISNIYGPGETSPRLVNTSLRKMLNKEHCAFSAGNQLYDFVYITDAAKMFIEIGKHGIANRTYYIGSQEPRPLKEFLCEMRDQVDPKIEIGLGEIPFNGVSLSYKEFDINAVKKDTGYIPEVTFAQGIKNTLEWIKEMG
jgi:UDP-glucose 4-epimerase